MARRLTSSQFRSKMRQLEQKQKRAIKDINRAVNSYNREVKKAVNNYNAAVRKHNANVRHNKQIIERELRKLKSKSTTHTSYAFSSIQMHQHYEVVNRVYAEGVTVTPEQDRILDLIEQEQANSLVTENYFEWDIEPEDTIENTEISNKLALISTDLNDRWNGAIFALNPQNPDATRHFCTSTREIFSQFFEIKAPDKDVFLHNPNCEKTEKGNATRREKIRYMMRNYNMDDSVVDFAEADIKNILELNQLLSGGTHGPAGKYPFNKLLQVKKRVEQGINFLCAISQ